MFHCTKQQKRDFRQMEKWRRVAAAVHPKEWRRRIDGIGKKTVRIQVAAIIWWDFCQYYPFGRLRKHIGKIMDKWTADMTPSREEVRRALVKIGFPKRVAIHRTTKAKDVPWGPMDIVETERTKENEALISGQNVYSESGGMK